MLLTEITPLILTYNELPNIDRTLKQLQWADRIVVVDSYSTDSTLDVLAGYSQVSLVQREFTSFADQCNFGLSLIHTEWVLSLDADYYLTYELIDEIKSLDENAWINGYLIQFRYCIFGKPLRGTLLPPRCVLYRQRQASYVNDGHAHRVLVEGRSAKLKNFIYHDDRKPLSRWLSSQEKYMVLEVQKLKETPNSELTLSDRIRKRKVLAPLIIVFYCLILKGGILDGWRGCYYALQRLLAEVLLALYLLDYELQSKRDNIL